MNRKMVQIDVAEVKKWLHEESFSAAFVSRELGLCENYLSVCFYNGKMSSTAFDLMTRKFGVDPKRIIAKPKREPVKTAPGYTCSVFVKPDKVLFSVSFDGKEIHKAYAKVKGQKELDLLQAISYAAHMVYKLAEQKELEAENA